VRASRPESEVPEESARNDIRRRGTVRRTAMLAARRIALLGAGFLGCRSAPTTAPSDGGWHTIDVTHREANVVVERVSYGGTGTQPRVFGQVCRPTGGATKHPVVVLNHGGFSGLKGDADGGLCVTLARKGYVAIEASYRGEDGSQGNVEACLGEVDDVLAMLTVALVQPYADSAHVGMLGSSHGGCVTLRALERGAPVRVAADGFGITDRQDRQVTSGSVAGANASTPSLPSRRGRSRSTWGGTATPPFTETSGLAPLVLAFLPSWTWRA
jgi:X-Pro dipeptidyl-peptidase (S15 family)